MSNLNYRKQRHLELLKLKKVLTSKESLELQQYSCVLDGHLDWETRDHYLALLESFEFYIGFKERNELNADVFDSLEANYLLLSPHKNSKKFSDFICEIMDLCNSYCEILESSLYQEKFDSYDLEFSDSIQKIYLKIQNFLNENRTTFKASKNFSELLDQLNWESKDQYFELIEKFLDESSISNFLDFKKKSESLLKVAKDLESNSFFLEPSYQALGFSNFINILIQLFEDYQTKTEMNSKVFKFWVGKTLLEMKNHYS